MSCAPPLCGQGLAFFSLFLVGGGRDGACRSPPPRSRSARVHARPWDAGRWAWRSALPGPALGPTSIASPPPRLPIPRAPPVVTRARRRPSPCRVFPLSLFFFFLFCLRLRLVCGPTLRGLHRGGLDICRAGAAPPPSPSIDVLRRVCWLAGVPPSAGEGVLSAVRRLIPLRPCYPARRGCLTRCTLGPDLGRADARARRLCRTLSRCRPRQPLAAIRARHAPCALPRACCWR